jgi:hypothetical protein
MDHTHAHIYHGTHTTQNAIHARHTNTHRVAVECEEAGENVFPKRPNHFIGRLSVFHHPGQVKTVGEKLIIVAPCDHERLGVAGLGGWRVGCGVS